MYSMNVWIEHLTQPLVLAGFGLFILWLVLKPLFATRCQKLPADAAERLISRGMHLVFFLAVLLIAVGFSLSVIKSNEAVLSEKKKVTPPESLLKKPTIPISLWLGEVGKTHFSQGEEPILYFRVNPEAFHPDAQSLFLTLLNITDDAVTLLIPRPTNNTSALNTAVQLGELYQMPRKTLKKGENARLDLELILDEIGTEQFKIIVTPEQMVWDEKWGDFENRLQGQRGRDFLKDLRKKAQQQAYWGEEDLEVVIE